MKLDRVTITGADDGISPEQLIPLTEKYPFVEWGILLSKSNEGMTRFPSYDWIKGFFKLQEHFPRISGHLCGRWVRQLCYGDIGFLEERPEFLQFNRIQLNFHALVHSVTVDAFIGALKIPEKFLKEVFKLPHAEEHRQYIFQLDDVNNKILDIARENGIDAVPLFDLSGGAGVLPEQWPKPYSGYNGYAGGLSPDNVESQLELIKQAAGDATIWIDVETHVRTNEVFDLKKVESFLEKSKRWVS